MEAEAGLFYFLYLALLGSLAAVLALLVKLSEEPNVQCVWLFAAVVDRRRGWRKQAVGCLLRSLLTFRDSLLAFTSTNVR